MDKRTMFALRWLVTLLLVSGFLLPFAIGVAAQEVLHTIASS